MGCSATNERMAIDDPPPRKRIKMSHNPNQSEDFQAYQNRINRERPMKNPGESESSDNDSYEDPSTIRKFKRAKVAVKNKKPKLAEVSEEEIESVLNQDDHEDHKRHKRRGDYDDPRKERPFHHREMDDYDGKTKPFKLGYEEEIYRGKNYGIPLQIYNQTWLTIDLPVEADCTCPKVEIPPGWRIPTIEDYKKLIRNAGGDEQARELMTHKKLLNMDSTCQYITSTKVFPREFNGYNNKAWMYYCIAFDYIDDVDVDPQGDIANGMPDQQSLAIQKQAEEKKKEKAEKKKNKKDPVISECDQDIHFGESEFINSMKKQLKENKDIYTPVDVNKVNERPKTAITQSMLIEDDGNREVRLVFNKENPYAVYMNGGEFGDRYKEESSEQKTIINPIKKKLIYRLNTFPLQKTTLRCKLIATEVLDIPFKCDLVLERNMRGFFEVPNVLNIVTFEWNFNDKYCDRKKNKSNKFVASHVFRYPGEYNVELYISLFAGRHFHLSKKIWVIDEIEFGEDEIIDGVNYGQPIRIGNQIWLDRDLTDYINIKNEMVSLKRGKGVGVHGENSFVDSICACPNGWRLPYKEEVEELLKVAGKNNEQQLFFFTMLKGGFNAEVSESGYYDMACLNFKEKEGKSIDPYSSFSHTNSNLTSFNKSKSNLNSEPKKGAEQVRLNTVNEESFSSNGSDNSAFNPMAMEKLRNYNDVILQYLNFGDIYNKEIYCLRIENNKVLIGTRTTSLNSAFSFFSTRCISDETLSLDLGLTEDSFPVHFDISLKLDYPNITSCEWDFGDGSEKVVDKKQVSHSYQEKGDYKIEVLLTLFGNRIRRVSSYVHIYGANEALGVDTKLLGANQIYIFQASEMFKVRRVERVHFTSQIAPIAPLQKEVGFYIAFNDMQDSTMKVFKVDLDKRAGTTIKDCLTNPIYSLYGGLPLDIVETSKGIAMLLSDIRDENLLFVQLVTPKGKVRWRNNIMQNGPNPLKAEANQLLFYDNKTESVHFGMSAMFKPFSGRISYCRGRILCIFSYMNHFGVSKGERNDNNGDTIITYTEDGSEVNLVSAWSTTHSLAQRVSTDGINLYTASLGDAGPANIKVLQIDPYIHGEGKKKDISNLKAEVLEIVKEKEKKEDIKKENGMIENGGRVNGSRVVTPNTQENNPNKMQIPMESQEPFLFLPIQGNKLSLAMSLRHNFLYGNMVNGSIPGDLVGNTSGRLGDLTYMGKDKTALVYSRIPCVDGGEINKVSEFACVMFNKELKVISQSIFKGGEGVNSIKQAKYGRNLFIMYGDTVKYTSEQKYQLDTVPFIDDSYNGKEGSCKCFLINNNGKKISETFNYHCNIFSPTDDFETLSDGSVVWVFSDQDNGLYICMLMIDDRMKSIKEVVAADAAANFFAKRDENAIRDRLLREKEILKSFGIDEEEEAKRREQYEEDMKRIKEKAEEEEEEEEEEKSVSIKESEKKSEKKSEKSSEKISKSKKSDNASGKGSKDKKSDKASVNKSSEKKSEDEISKQSKPSSKKAPKVSKRRRKETPSSSQTPSSSKKSKLEKMRKVDLDGPSSSDDESEMPDSEKKDINVELIPEFQTYANNLQTKQEERFDPTKNYYM